MNSTNSKAEIRSATVESQRQAKSDPEKFAWLAKLTGGWILAVGLFLFLGSVATELLLLKREEANEPRRSLKVAMIADCATILKELGGVLIVGYLVRELIENRHQEAWQTNMQERVSTVLAPAISEVRSLTKDLGITLRNNLIIEDEAARNELTEKVLRPDFIRRKYRLTLTLESTGIAGILKVATETEYILQNVGDKEKEYTITGWIDTARDQWLNPIQSSKFTFLTYGPELLKDEDKHRPTDLDPLHNSLVKLIRTDEALILRYPIHPAIPKGGRYFISLMATQYMQLHDQFVWNMVHVTDGLDVVVRLQGEINWNNFKVTPRLLHHQDEFSNPSPTPANGECVWSLRNILLPYQGVQIWWSPLDSELGTTIS